MSVTDKQLVRQLVDAAYESGYYSGKREDGQPHHKEAIARREELRRKLLERLSARSAQAKPQPNRVALILEQVAPKTTTVEILAERPEELVLIINQEPFGTLVFGGPHGRPICKLNTVKEVEA